MTVSAWGAGPLGISVQSVYEGRASGPTPLRIRVSNTGRDAVGWVVIAGDDMARVRYPVALPRGSVKEVHALAAFSPYGMGAKITLETDRGRVEALLPPHLTEYSNEQGAALMIGGAAGELSFLENTGKLFVRPEDASARPLGYGAVGFVAMGEGAERMSDEAVSALQRWALTGGTILFFGGASSPLLHDPRWTPLLPMRVTGSRDVLVPRSVEKQWGRPMPATPIPVVTGTLAPGARVVVRGRVPLVLESRIGSGRVVLFAFNPFEGPLRTWPGIVKLFGRHVTPLPSQSMRQFDPNAGYYSYPSSSSVAYAGTGAYTYREEFSSPFSVQMPAAETIVALLIGYVIAVVPINFLILRKLRRGEWAWVTSPLISLGFAAVFLSFAGALYKTPMGRSVTGTLYLDSRVPTGYFVGRAQLFVPRGGAYDLKLHDVDWIAPPSVFEYGSVRSTIDMGLIDTGEITAKDARFPNLAFHEFGFAQNVPTEQWITATNAVFERKQWTVTLANHSPYELRVKAARAGATEPETVVKPGESKPLVVGGETRPGSVSIVGRLVGFSPGPDLGRDFQGQAGGIDLAAQIHVPGKETP